MPNHCETDLYIKGNQTEIAKLLEFLGIAKDGNSGVDLCHALIPYPEHFAQRDAEAPEWGEADYDAKITAFEDKWGSTEDGFNSGGHEWRLENWGTKWGTYARRFNFKENKLSFKCAWGPPSQEAFKALQKRFPKLTFHVEYFERGQAFCGGYTLYSQEDYDRDGEWQIGSIFDEWTAKYRGHRGG